jgi:ATP-dependent Lon protease
MAMAAFSTPPSLPLFPLAHPLVLFPASRITVPISKDSGRALISLIQDSPGQPLIAAVPILHPPTDKSGVIQDAAGGGTVLNEWGCAAQVIRLIRPSALQPAQPYLLTLQGVTRIRLEPPLPSLESLDAVDFTFHPVVYPTAKGTPAPEHVEAFKVSGVRLLDRMAKDSGPGQVVGPGAGKRDALWRLRDTLEDVTDDRAHVLADTLVSLISGEFSDKLGASFGPGMCVAPSR